MRMTRAAVVPLLIALLALAAPPAGAQESPEKALEEQVFPPELVMKHAQRLGLTGAQREEITRAIQRVQARTVEVQWKLQDELDRLVQLLRVARPDETAVLAQMDKVLDLERTVKREQMQMLVRIKGALTREQQETLRSLR